LQGRSVLTTAALIAAGSSLPKLLVYDFRQDDPKKCTSARLRKFRLVQSISSLKRIPSSAIVLNPTSSRTLSHQDRELVQREGLVALDCSWNLSEGVFDRNIPGINRRLPLLLAGNPTNYGIAGRLSTAEALAAALILTGFRQPAEVILSLFKWGETFLSLNHDPLEKYAIANSPELSALEEEFFGLR
jgi:pre-rRNA-processing protein TSR3